MMKRKYIVFMVIGICIVIGILLILLYKTEKPSLYQYDPKNPPIARQPPNPPISTTPPIVPTLRCGDIDEDGYVTLTDSILLTEIQGFFPQGDVNNDGNIDENDISLIEKAVLENLELNCGNICGNHVLEGKEECEIDLDCPGDDKCIDCECREKKAGELVRTCGKKWFSSIPYDRCESPGACPQGYCSAKTCECEKPCADTGISWGGFSGTVSTCVDNCPKFLGYSCNFKTCSCVKTDSSRSRQDNKGEADYTEDADAQEEDQETPQEVSQQKPDDTGLTTASAADASATDQAGLLMALS